MKLKTLAIETLQNLTLEELNNVILKLSLITTQNKHKHINKEELQSFYNLVNNLSDFIDNNDNLNYFKKGVNRYE